MTKSGDKVGKAKKNYMYNSKKYSRKKSMNRKYSTSWRKRQRGNAGWKKSTRSSNVGKKKRSRGRKS